MNYSKRQCLKNLHLKSTNSSNIFVIHIDIFNMKRVYVLKVNSSIFVCLIVQHLYFEVYILTSKVQDLIVIHIICSMLKDPFLKTYISEVNN